MSLRLLSLLRSSVANVSRFSTLVGEFDGKEPEPEPIKKVLVDPDVNPLMKSRKLDKVPQFSEPRQAWIETLSCIDDKVVGLTHLHPEIFGEPPRIDLIHYNIKWQRKFRFVAFTHVKNRFEMPGTHKKPRPQKGTGRSRHGDLRSPLFTKTGGVAHGPRSPTTHFFMLPFMTRLRGLTSTLSIKHAQTQAKIPPFRRFPSSGSSLPMAVRKVVEEPVIQFHLISDTHQTPTAEEPFDMDDLHVIDSLDIPTDNKGYLIDLVEARNWGPSVLFVDVPDIMPRNITAATDEVDHFNLMPVYGLNVYSMLKHETLVLTIDAVKRIEEKILYHLHRVDKEKICSKFRYN